MLRLFAQRCAVALGGPAVVVVVVVAVVIAVAMVVVVGSHPLHVLSQLSAAVSHNFRDRIV